MSRQQTIFRRAHASSFVAVSNELARNATLSHQARGALLWLLSYPADWDVKIDSLVTPANSLKAVRKIVQELEDAGYVYRQRERDAATGRLGPTVFMVYEDPLPDGERSGADRRQRNQPRTKNGHMDPHAQNGNVGTQAKTREKSPHAQNPHRGKGHTTKTETTQKTETTTNTVAVIVHEPEPERPTVYAEYERQFGFSLTPGVADTLKDMVAEYGEDWTRDALTITATAGKRGNLRYTLAILRNWQRDGRDVEPKAATVIVDEKTAWRASQKARPNVRYDAALDMVLPAFQDEDDRRRYITDYLGMDYVPYAKELVS